MSAKPVQRKQQKRVIIQVFSRHPEKNKSCPADCDHCDKPCCRRKASGSD